MIVVITLTVRQECKECIVTRCVFIRVWLRAPLVSNRVDEKGYVVSRHDAQEARQKQHAPYITEDQAQCQRYTNVHRKNDRHIVLVLPHNDWIFHQVLHVSEIYATTWVFADHPTHVREPQTALRRVRVFIHVVTVTVVYTVARTPVEDGVLKRCRTPQRIPDTQNRVGIISIMRPQTVVTASNRHAGNPGQHQVGDPG